MTREDLLALVTIVLQISEVQSEQLKLHMTMFENFNRVLGLRDALSQMPAGEEADELRKELDALSNDHNTKMEVLHGHLRDYLARGEFMRDQLMAVIERMKGESPEAASG